MSTWQPPWSAQGQVAVTLLPPTRASNSVTARRPPVPGSMAALRAGSRGAPAPRDLPVDLAGRAGAGPTTHRPRWGQASPAQPYRPAPHERTTRQAATDPTRP